MTGTGTMTDPYIVDNFTDFLTAAAITGAYVAFDENAENKVIELNDTEYADGLTSTVNINAAQILGNGWTIRNLYFSAQSNLFLINGTQIDSLNLLNLVTSTPSCSVMYCLGSMCWSNSSFSGSISFGASNGQVINCTTSSGGDTFRNCSFCLECNLSSSIQRVFYNGTYESCNLELYFSLVSPTSQQSFLQMCRMQNSCIRGRAYVSGTGAKLMVNGGTMNSTYFALHIQQSEGEESTPAIQFKASSYTTVCFYDADLIADALTVTSNTASMVGLTTAQCKDAAYLTSIGFPCVEVEA